MKERRDPQTGGFQFWETACQTGFMAVKAHTKSHCKYTTKIGFCQEVNAFLTIIKSF